MKLRNVENAEQGLATMKECESEPGLGKKKWMKGKDAVRGPLGPKSLHWLTGSTSVITSVQTVSTTLPPTHFL